MSIRMIKYCGKTVILPLILISKPMLYESVFHYNWKKSKLRPIHKK